MATSEAQQRQALNRLYDLAKRELGDALALVPDPADTAAVVEVITTYVPAICERYGLAAGTLAADWYEDLRDQAEAAGYFRAVMSDLPDRRRYEALAAWAATKDDIETLVGGGVQRIIANMHRHTVMQSAFADPAADGWARFGNGATCDFCLMLVSRGGIYRESSATFATHDHCDCGAGPIWKGLAGARQVDAYKASARRRSDSTRESDNARARAWIESNL